ncbi:MAG: hypothetical protein EHM59_13280, partial [Betaproteobacteria bacterium]
MRRARRPSQCGELLERPEERRWRLPQSSPPSSMPRATFRQPSSACQPPRAPESSSCKGQRAEDEGDGACQRSGRRRRRRNRNPSDVASCRMALPRQDLQAGFHIGEFLVEPRQNRIVRGDAEAHVEPRVMDVLICLAEHAGEVVSRETLNQRVWGNVVVTDQAVTNCISELRHHLGDDRSANRVIETVPKRGYRLVAPVLAAPLQRAHPVSPPAAGKRRNVAAGLLLTATALLAGGWWWWRSASDPGLSSVAVMHFENAAGDEALDYLGLALPDEIATLLTKSRQLAVRPFGYVDGEDPLAAARERKVDHIVSGRYYLEDNGRLSLAIEAQYVPHERVIWRTRITAPVGDLLAMRGRIADGVRQGLLPALGVRAVPTSGSTPTNAAAYQLYLHSLALPQQPKPTERAIEMLEEVVTLEPAFAPAWQALGLRYYDYGTYGTG